MVLYDPKEYERRVKAVLEGNILESTIRETADMLGQQQNLLRGISLDAMRRGIALSLCSHLRFGLCMQVVSSD